MPEKRKHITIKDIAMQSGVSVSTVSRALDPVKKNLINIKTRQKLNRWQNNRISPAISLPDVKREKSEAISLVFSSDIFSAPSTRRQ